ncbi:MAG: hypothetical protein Q4G43_06350, partial [Mobilicoccus sp.]|nr:hypothetical protein [Mobilicoccus sp.]
EPHLVRLRLIAALRGIVGASIDEIRELVRMLDDPDESLYRIFGRAQLLGLGLPGECDSGLDDEPPEVTELVEARGWTRAIEVRALLGAHVRSATAAGVPMDRAILTTYADAAEHAARVDVEAVGRAGSRDEAVMMVAVGVHTHSRLLLRLLAVAQAGRALDIAD